MMGRRRRSDRSGRAPLFSPGHPVVAGRDRQRRFWAAIAAGMASGYPAIEMNSSSVTVRQRGVGLRCRPIGQQISCCDDQ
jgi:hypothetical protein